jgi:hypothetical protein
MMNESIILGDITIIVHYKMISLYSFIDLFSFSIENFNFMQLEMVIFYINIFNNLINILFLVFCFKLRNSVFLGKKS